MQCSFNFSCLQFIDVLFANTHLVILEFLKVLPAIYRIEETQIFKLVSIFKTKLHRSSLTHHWFPLRLNCPVLQSVHRLRSTGPVSRTAHVWMTAISASPTFFRSFTVLKNRLKLFDGTGRIRSPRSHTVFLRFHVFSITRFECNALLIDGQRREYFLRCWSVGSSCGAPNVNRPLSKLFMYVRLPVWMATVPVISSNFVACHQPPCLIASSSTMTRFFSLFFLCACVYASLPWKRENNTIDGFSHSNVVCAAHNTHLDVSPFSTSLPTRTLSWSDIWRTIKI